MKSFALLMLVVAVAGGAWAAQPGTTLHSMDVVKTQDLSSYAGTVTAVDAAKFTLTINGHEVTTSVHQKTLTHDSTATKKKPAAKDPAKDTPRHFLVDPGCRVVGVDKVPATLASIGTNSVVVAKYSTTKDFDRKTKLTIEEISVTRIK